MLEGDIGPAHILVLTAGSANRAGDDASNIPIATDSVYTEPDCYGDTDEHEATRAQARYEAIKSTAEVDSRLIPP